MKWRLPLLIFSIGLTVWGILPLLIARIKGVGVICPVILGVMGMVAAFFPRIPLSLIDAVKGAGKGVQIGAWALIAVIGLLVLLFLMVSVIMVCNGWRTAHTDQVTVVVPGALIRGDKPSLMLSHRLQVAAEYLNEHPDACCVVSGGQGIDEEFSEAQVMKSYLVSLGIDGNRIYMEDKSTSTWENMQFTAEIIEKNGLSTDIVIATQEFHQFRSAAYAKRAGLTPVATATCGTPWYLFLCYWVREFAAINRMWMLGY
jgi:uncharacterized SAM-binding protein YcdF (DUF218 family)